MIGLVIVTVGIILMAIASPCGVGLAPALAVGLVVCAGGIYVTRKELS